MAQKEKETVIEREHIVKRHRLVLENGEQNVQKMENSVANVEEIM